MTRGLDVDGRAVRVSGPGYVRDYVAPVLDLTWSTEAEWTAGDTTAEGFDPSGGTLTLVPGIEDFERYAPGENMTDYGWNAVSTPSPAAQTTNVSEGSIAVAAQTKDGGAGYADLSGLGDVQPDSVRFDADETSNHGGFAVKYFDSNSDVIVSVGSANPQVAYRTNVASGCLLSNPTPEYNAWRRYELQFDWSAQTFDFVWTDLTGSSGTVSVTDVPFNANGIDKVQLGQDGSLNACGGKANNGDEAFYDNVWGPKYKGVYRTGTQSYGSPQTPDLGSLSYSLNGGSGSIDVIGSPGTASEETVTQSLDGGTTYSLSWGSAHTDFRIRVTATNDGTAEPTVSAVSLTA